MTPILRRRANREKQILTALIYHVTKSTYYESNIASLSVTSNKRYHELYQERIMDSYSILRENVFAKPNLKFSGTIETWAWCISKIKVNQHPSYFLED